ncbi:MAG: glutamyl-tRNA reductase [Planctomycetes bacterium]|nr:glutamyl-tRNA reductase [Planctomycetota bacterium]
MLTLLGLSHRHAPLDVRERLAVASDDLPALMQRLPAHLGAGAILATCNRLEVYLPGSHDREQVLDFLAEEGGTDRELAGDYFQYLRDGEAVSHLYSVAAGIDSMILGESEILGQVRDAFSATVAAGADDAVLSRLFHTAIRVGRRARAETDIGHHAISISSIAAQQARTLHPDVERATVLVLGAGEAGRVAAEALVDRGVGDVLVANRTASRAEGLAAALGGRAVPFDRLVDALAESDVVIAASGSPDHLINRQQLVEAMARRDGKPLVAIDIGLPRDFDPAVRDVPGVIYRDLDDLQAIAAEHFRAREAEVDGVRAIVAQETQRFVDWWDQLQVVPTVAALTERAEQFRRREVAKSLRRLDLSQGQEEQLETLTKALVKQILHDPISTLRERGDRDLYVDAVRTLFHLDEPPARDDDA